MTLSETAWAKINLALHVRARHADGYHAIETLFVFAEDGDRLSAEEADELSLDIRGPFAGALADEPDNLVLRAARAIRKAYGVRRGARMVLEKNVPVAAGLGGGSADAAAALRLLPRLWQLETSPVSVRAIARELGADVPACLESRILRGEGRGDELRTLDDMSLSGAPILLVNPRIPLTTGPVFKGWDRIDRGALDAGPPLRAALTGRNDLEPSAFALVPEIGELVGAMQDLPDLKLARMSGSGATCFALFESDAAMKAGAAELMARWPGYWYCETRLKQAESSVSR